MDNNYSFKQRVCETAINCSKIYMSEFVENSYLICSNAFTNNPIFNSNVEKWTVKNASARIIKLRDELRKQLSE